MIDIRKFRRNGSGIVVFVEEPQQKWCGWFWVSVDYIVEINEERIRLFYENRFKEIETWRAIFCWHSNMPNEGWYGPQSMRLENSTGKLARNVTLMHDELVPNRLLKHNMHAFTGHNVAQRRGPLQPMNKTVWSDITEVFFPHEEDAILAANLITVLDVDDIRKMNQEHRYNQYSYARILAFEDDEIQHRDRLSVPKSRYEMVGPSGQKFFFDFEAFGGSFAELTSVQRPDK